MPDPFQSLQVTHRRLHEQIAESIQDMIIKGRVQPGTRLPPERDLAAQLGVSRATVSQAIRVLEQRGLVQMQPGSGTVVTDKARVAFIESMERLFLFSNSSYEDLMAFREIIEPSMAALAAMHATCEDLAAIKECAEQTEEAFHREDIEQCAIADADFHTALAYATSNELVIAATTGVQSLLRSAMDAQVRAHRDLEGLRNHWSIYDAVAAHDPERARVAMEEHMRLARQAIRRVSERSADSHS